MNKKHKIFSAVIMIFSFLYLIFAPFVFLPNLNIDIYTQKEKNKEEEYRGIVTLWNVSDSYSVPRTFLSYFVQNAEKNNVRFFIETEHMTVDTAKERMASGEKPDLISFTHGLFDSPSLLDSLENDEAIILNAALSSMYENTLFAYPYMAHIKYPEDKTLPTEMQYYYIGITKNDDPLKTKMLKKVIKYLISERLQKAVAEKEFIPLCVYDGIYETEDNNSAIYDLIFGEIYIPSVFSAPSL